jgi:hypothetical protein
LKKFAFLIVIALLVLSLTGCSSNNSSDGYGELALNIADRPVNDVAEILVTIDEVQVHKDGVWEVINNFEDEGGEKEFDLLELRFEKALLGQERLAAGEYDQIRLIVASEEGNGDPKELIKSRVVYKEEINRADDKLFIPSGMQTGLKINHNFIIQEGSITELTLDVNAADMLDQLNEAGNSGKIILGPTSIKIIDEIVSGSITGQVLNGTLETPEAVIDQDVIVEAYESDADIETADPVASTVALSKEDDKGRPAGSFFLRGLEAGTYKIKAYTSDESLNAIKEDIEVTAEETTDIGEILLESEDAGDTADSGEEQ